MSKKSILPKSRRHIWVYDEDWEFLTKWRKSTPGFSNDEVYGNGAIICEMIHKRVLAAKDQQIRHLDQMTSSGGKLHDRTRPVPSN